MAKVMIVDDEKNLLESLGRILSGEGYEIKLVSSGADALNSLKGFKPDVILLDVKMPEMDGFDVCRRIRSDKNDAIRNIPVIMITGYSYEREGILSTGADDFMEKPLERADVIIRTKCALKIGKLVDKLERANVYLDELKKAGKLG